MKEVRKQLEQIKKAHIFKREGFLNTKKNTKNENRVALTFPFNKAARNISISMKKHWSMLNRNMNLRKSFESKPITSFRRKKLSEKIIGNKTFSNKDLIA